MRWIRNQGEIPYLFSMPFVEVNMEQLLQEMSAYSDLLIILGVLVLAIVSLYSKVSGKKTKKNNFSLFGYVFFDFSNLNNQIYAQ